MKNDIPEKGAIVQRDKETFAVAPHIPGGIIDPTVRVRCLLSRKLNKKRRKNMAKCVKESPKDSKDEYEDKTQFNGDK